MLSIFTNNINFLTLLIVGMRTRKDSTPLVKN